MYRQPGQLMKWQLNVMLMANQPGVMSAGISFAANGGSLSVALKLA